MDNKLQKLKLEKIKKPSISEREVSRETGLSATTAGSLLYKKVTDVEIIPVIAKWLEVSLS
jgi:lambda repressor-like predicted transcriptional regulator